MLTVRLNNMELSVTFGFLLLIAIYALIGDNAAIYCLVFSAVHELAHLAAMRAHGIQIDYIRLYGGGIKISSSDISLLSKSAQMLIYSAGCFINMILGLIFLCFGMAGASAINFCLGAFNLLPVEYFDGGKLIALYVLEKRLHLKILSAVFTAFIGAAAIIGAFAFIGKIPLSLTAMAVLIILSELLDN